MMWNVASHQNNAPVAEDNRGDKERFDKKEERRQG
jgi:hypothetical protein